MARYFVGWIDEQKMNDSCIDCRLDGWLNGLLHELLVGWIDRLMEELMDR